MTSTSAFKKLGVALAASALTACTGGFTTSSKFMKEIASSVGDSSGSSGNVTPAPGNTTPGTSLPDVAAGPTNGTPGSTSTPIPVNNQPSPLGPARPDQCSSSVRRGLAKEGARRLNRTELIATLKAVWPDGGRVDALMINYPEVAEMSEVERYDQLHSYGQALDITQIVEGLVENALAQRLMGRLSDACMDQAQPTDACWQQFFASYGRKVFRRPVKSEESARFVGYVKSRASYEDKVRVALHVLFRSPDFLFHYEAGATEEADRVRLTDHEVANRIAYGATGAPPDAELAAAADRGDLKSIANVRAHVTRLLGTQAARKNIASFFTEWLQLSHINEPTFELLEWIEGLSKAGGTEVVYRQEILDYVEHIVWRAQGSYQDLMTKTIAFPREQGTDYSNGKLFSMLSGIYGNDKYTGFTSRNEAVAQPMDAPKHPGLMFRAGFMATPGLATHPIPRGVFVKRRILCDIMPSPDFTVVNQRLEEVGNLDPMAIPNHQIWSQKTAAPACMGCHASINPIGFVFEGFDPIGKARDKQNVWDMNLFYSSTKGLAKQFDLPLPLTNVRLGEKSVNVTSPHQFAQEVATSTKAQACMATFFLRHLERRVENGGDNCAINEAASLMAQGRPLTDLFVQSIANEDIFWRRK